MAGAGLVFLGDGHGPLRIASLLVREVIGMTYLLNLPSISLTVTTLTLTMIIIIIMEILGLTD